MFNFVRPVALSLLVLLGIVLCCSPVYGAADCATTKANSLPDSVKNISLKSVPFGSPGTIVSLTIDGKGLAGYTPFLCFRLPGQDTNHAPAQYLKFEKQPDNAHETNAGSNSNANASRANANTKPVSESQSDSSSTADTPIKGYVSISLSAVLGNYGIFLQNGDNLYDTTLNLTVRSPNTGEYFDCPTDGRPVPAQRDLYCSEALLPYDDTRNIFGKGIADRYIVAQVTVKNLSEDYEYILHDIRLGTTESVVASIDRKLIRGLGEKTEQFSARAIAVRLTQAGATLLTGIAGVAGNGNLTDAASLVAGPVSTGLQSVIPDLTQAELNRINDLGFSAGQVVVPKHSALPMVVFLADFFRPQDKKFKKFNRTDLMTLQKGLIVQVSGAHVQEVNTASVTTLDNFPTDLSKLKTDNKDVTVTLEGENLDSIRKIHLTSDGQPASTFTYVTSNGKFTVPASDSSKLKPGTYTVTFDTDENSANTSPVSIVITDQPANAAAESTITDLKNFPKTLSSFTSDTKVSLTGTDIDVVTYIHLTTAGQPALSYPVKDGSFTIPVADKGKLQQGKTYAVTFDTGATSNVSASFTEKIEP